MWEYYAIIGLALVVFIAPLVYLVALGIRQSNR